MRWGKCERYKVSVRTAVAVASLVRQAPAIVKMKITRNRGIKVEWGRFATLVLG